MPFYRRRLPHLDQIEQAAFVTWRLHGSLPPNRPFPALSSAQAFAAMDRLLDETRGGPFHLRQPAAADMVVDGRPGGRPRTRGSAPPMGPNL